MAEEDNSSNPAESKGEEAAGGSGNEENEEMDTEDKSNTPKDADSSQSSAKEEKKDGESEDMHDGEKPKKKYTTWPLREIKEPHENDVLYGRGGGTNHHPGNKRYRKIVEDKKLSYVNSKRLDKPLVALEIIKSWRAQDPPGRFLKFSEKTGLWEDVGDKKAREKTSQALRERAPEIRRKQEEEEEAAKHENEGDSGEDPKEAKSTRFADGTSDKRMNDVKRSVLARDHSLGREYIPNGEAVTLDGFTWSEGVDPRSLSSGSLPGISYPAGRNTSTGSVGVPPPQHYPPNHRMGSHSSMGTPPPPGGYYDRNMSGLSTLSMGPMDDRSREHSTERRYEYWERFPSGSSLGGGSMGQLPPMGPPMPIRYASGEYPQPRGYGSGSSESSSRRHDAFMASREHSLSGVPLRDASTNHPASPFDMYGSGYWSNQSFPPPPPPPYEMPGQYPSPGRWMSGDSGYGLGRTPSGSFDPMMHQNQNMGPPMAHGGEMGYRHGRVQSGNSFDPMMSRSPPHSRPAPNHCPPYDHVRTQSGNSYDPMIRREKCNPKEQARSGSKYFDTWSSQPEDFEKVATMFNEEMPSSWSGQTARHSIPPTESSAFRGHESDSAGLIVTRRGDLPRPDVVKRNTSNQNEDESNKRGLAGGSVKRAALNRDSSAVANALKEKYPPSALNRPGVIKDRGVSVQEMDMLKDSLEQSKLSVDRPKASNPERSNSMDAITQDLLAKPSVFNIGNRTSTIDALTFELGLDTDSDHVTNAQGLPRPPPFRAGDRLSTAEYLNIVNEPIDDESESIAQLDTTRAVSVNDWLTDDSG